MTITHAELLEIIHNGENSGVEFKRDTIQSHELAKELVALLNFEGGMVLLGVEDNGSISGIMREKLEEWVMTTARDKIRPAIIPFFEIVKNVETSKVEDGITVAGILLFGKNPNRFLPQAGIDAAAYLGTEKDYAARERRSLRGPMTPLLSRDKKIVEAGLVEQAMGFIQRNTTVTSKLEAEGGRREDISQYPREALREAIVNALIHRDYLLSSTDIELSIYSDRLEIISPGRLANGITPARMLSGCRAARNQLIKDVMRDYRNLEHSGMGIPRKIVKGMREHNGTTPVLIEEDERFTIRLIS